MIQNSNRTYTVSDLAAELNLPRSTVNDWLKLYAPWLDGEQRGRRKVYFDSARAILIEIAAQRNAGSSNEEIERALAAAHGLRPEPVPPEPPVPAAAPGAGISTLPAARTDALPAAFDPALLLTRFEELEKRRRKSVRNFLLAFAVLLTLLMLLGAAGGGLLLQAQRRSAEANLAAAAAENARCRAEAEATHNRRMSELTRDHDRRLEALAEAHRRRVAELAAGTGAALEKLSGQTARELEKQNAALAEKIAGAQRLDATEIARLRSGLEAQKKEFSELIRALAAGNRQEELRRIREKEEFARLRKELLTQLESANRAALAAEREAVRRTAAELEKLRAERAARPAPPAAPANRLQNPGAAAPVQQTGKQEK